VLCSVAETPEIVPFVRITSPPINMSEPQKPVSGGIKRNQTLRGSVEEHIQDPDNASSESVVSTWAVESKIGGDEKVSIWRCMCQRQNENAI
jgi:hypothetical protein